MIKLHIGTSNLPDYLDNEILNLYEICKKKGIFFHSSKSYKNVKIYFDNLNLNKTSKTNLITKIHTSKNPIKNIMLHKQLIDNKNFFNVDKLNAIQLCNNLGGNIINAFLLKKILFFLKKKK